jgi:hypothetical protein
LVRPTAELSTPEAVFTYPIAQVDVALATFKNPKLTVFCAVDEFWFPTAIAPYAVLATFLKPTANDLSDCARLATPTAVELIPIEAWAVCGSLMITPVAGSMFVVVATLFITPRATADKLVADAKFERPQTVALFAPAGTVHP